ncbi:class I SAM-dependent methyltransferase [Oxalobacteraceae bacterium]|nr:class I SAM-dependent methyltransferase [Oxalobacteraceae bacterium]
MKSTNVELNTLPMEAHVEETAFGKWFLRTQTWTVHVLDRALNDLERLMPHRPRSFPVVADVGCGWGRSLPKLQERFAPTRLIAMDIDPEMLANSKSEMEGQNIQAEYICCSSSNILLEDNSVDMLFCHQTFHHLIDQEAAIAEFMRVLKPGGVLLFAESTKRYIDSWIIRLLFRHPMEVQKTAPEYLKLVRDAGFIVPDAAVSYPFLWWSREDLGVLESVFRIAPRAQREETLINLIATKPRI